MKKYFYILFFLFFLKTTFSQSLLSQKDYADSLFVAENYYDAVTEYKRLLFFSQTNEYNYSAFYNIALSYKAGGLYNEAIRYFRKAEQNASVQKDSINCNLQIIRCNILRRTIPEAFILLDKLQKTYNVDSNILYYWRGWAYMFDNKWDSASNEFMKINKKHELKILADSIYAEQYSVAFAKVVSFIIPGAGQFYTGNYFSGFLSLGWNVLWGYMTIHAFLTDRALEGILMGGLLWARFYRGNFQNAEKFAIQKNVEIADKGYEYLAKTYKGEKP